MKYRIRCIHDQSNYSLAGTRRGLPLPENSLHFTPDFRHPDHKNGTSHSKNQPALHPNPLIFHPSLPDLASPQSCRSNSGVCMGRKTVTRDALPEKNRTRQRRMRSKNS
jgi:hypothetical protein